MYAYAMLLFFFFNFFFLFIPNDMYDETEQKTWRKIIECQVVGER